MIIQLITNYYTVMAIGTLGTAIGTVAILAAWRLRDRRNGADR